MRKLLMLSLTLSAIQLHAQTPDTTYKTSQDYGSAVTHDTMSIYPHYYQISRRDTTMGLVLQGDARAGSCANVWCALVRQASGTSVNYNQSGGTFSSFNDAAHEIVRFWNLSHPGDTVATPVVVPPVVVPPVDTMPTVPVVDTSAIATRVVCPTTAKYRTCYRVTINAVEIGWVRQADTSITRRWIAGRGTVSFAPWYTTMKAATERLVYDWHITPYPPVIDTTHKTIFVYDTVHTKVVMPPDTVWNHVAVTKYDTTHVTVTLYDTVRVVTTRDTVFMRAGDTLSLQHGDTIVIPIRVLPKCSCDTTKVDSTQPELPRYMKEMDAMLASARASDTVTRQVFDQDPVTKGLVARKDSTGAFVCSNIITFADAQGKMWEKPQYFPCPQAVVDAVKARSITP